MITVHHVLADGTEVADIAGKVVKAKDNEQVYEAINRIQEGIHIVESEVMPNETISTSN